MDIRRITDSYAVSPQIAPEDAVAIREAGFTTVIDNRPDPEIPENLHTDAMRAAIEAEGLTFVANPVVPGGLTADVVEGQRAAIADATGPVLAYCASGNRSSIIWALVNPEGLGVDDLVGLPAQHGYDLNHLRPLLDR